MEVHEAYQVLQKLMEKGRGDMELIYRDVRSGDTGSVLISANIQSVMGQEDMGILCDEEIGYEYVPVYCDH